MTTLATALRDERCELAALRLLLGLLAAWGVCPDPCPADTNLDGNVNVTDLLTLLANWG